MGIEQIRMNQTKALPPVPQFNWSQMESNRAESYDSLVAPEKIGKLGWCGSMWRSERKILTQDPAHRCYLLPRGKRIRLVQKRKKEKKADPFQNRKDRAPSVPKFQHYIGLIAFAKVANSNKNIADSVGHPPTGLYFYRARY